MTSEQIQQYVYDFLYSKGLAHATICAIMGNITGESSWDVDAIEYGSGIGFGLCQWSFGRREQLERYGVTLQHQCEFLWSELTGENSDITGGSIQWIDTPIEAVTGGEMFGSFSLDDFLQGNSSLDLLTKAFCFCWERPQYNEHNIYEIRIPSASHFYDIMHPNGNPDIPIPPTPDKKKGMSKLLLYYSGTRRR